MERDKYEEAIRVVQSDRDAAEWSRRHEEGEVRIGVSRHCISVDAYDLAIAALREKQQREKEKADG